MIPDSLLQMYDDIKNDTSKPIQSTIGPKPTTVVLRNKCINHANDLREKCRKHLLLDIYCKILPLDDDFINDNQCQMKSDIDCMLKGKGMNATQYLTSAFESTNAPLLEFIMRSTDLIGREYVEKCEKLFKEAEENGTEPVEPEEPDVEDQDVNNSLIDIKNDTEYKSFVDKLRNKTINKIVSDISNIISDKKNENDITFSSESAVVTSMDYLQKFNWGKNLTESENENILGLAIRESTLRELDLVFNQPITFREFATMIRTGKGYIINEAALKSIFDDSVAEKQGPDEDKRRQEMSKYPDTDGSFSGDTK